MYYPLYIRRGLSTEGNLRFEIDWVSLIAGSKFTFVLLCFTLYLRAIFQVQVPGGLYLERRFNGGFFALRVWGVYIWRGLFSEFYGISKKKPVNLITLSYARFRKWVSWRKYCFLIDYLSFPLGILLQWSRSNVFIDLETPSMRKTNKQTPSPKFCTTFFLNFS